MSDFKESILSGLEECLQGLRHAMEDLAPSEVRWQPTLHTNHIAWLAWHTARAEDTWISRMQESSEVWNAEGWADRFQMDPVSNGVDHTMEEVRAMPDIPLTELIAYFDAVRAVTRNHSPRYRHRPGPGVPILALGNRHTRLDLRTYSRRDKRTCRSGRAAPGDDPRNRVARDGRRAQVWAFTVSLKQSN